MTRLELEYYQTMMAQSKKQTEALESIAKALATIADIVMFKDFEDFEKSQT